jgi:hypothetical protein
MYKEYIELSNMMSFIGYINNVPVMIEFRIYFIIFCTCIFSEKLWTSFLSDLMYLQSTVMQTSIKMLVPILYIHFFPEKYLR